jgi:hypothetical protein
MPGLDPGIHAFFLCNEKLDVDGRDEPGHDGEQAERMGIAAVYAPKSKYKVFWALILAGGAERRR